MTFWAEIEKKNPKFHMESQGTLDSQNNLEKKQTWGPCTSWFQKILMKQHSNECDTGINTDK